jgi:hypothetical protein
MVLFGVSNGGMMRLSDGWVEQLKTNVKQTCWFFEQQHLHI